MTIITLQNTSFFSAVFRGAMFTVPLSATYWPHLCAACTSLCRVDDIQVHPSRTSPVLSLCPVLAVCVNCLTFGKHFKGVFLSIF